MGRTTDGVDNPDELELDVRFPRGIAAGAERAGELGFDFATLVAAHGELIEAGSARALVGEAGLAIDAHGEIVGEGQDASYRGHRVRVRGDGAEALAMAIRILDEQMLADFSEEERWHVRIEAEKLAVAAVGRGDEGWLEALARLEERERAEHGHALSQFAPGHPDHALAAADQGGSMAVAGAPVCMVVERMATSWLAIGASDPGLALDLLIELVDFDRPPSSALALPRLRLHDRAGHPYLLCEPDVHAKLRLGLEGRGHELVSPEPSEPFPGEGTILRRVGSGPRRERRAARRRSLRFAA